MVVAVLVQVVPTVEQFFYFIDLFFRVTYLVINDSCTAHDSIVVESVVADVCLLSIAAQVIKLVNVDSVG